MSVAMTPSSNQLPKINSAELIAKINELIEDQRYFQQICETLDSIVDTKSLSKFGKKRKITELLLELQAQKAAEKDLDDIINHGN